MSKKNWQIWKEKILYKKYSENFTNTQFKIPFGMASLFPYSIWNLATCKLLWMTLGMCQISVPNSCLTQCIAKDPPDHWMTCSWFDCLGQKFFQFDSAIRFKKFASSDMDSFWNSRAMNSISMAKISIDIDSVSLSPRTTLPRNTHFTVFCLDVIIGNSF